MRPEVIDFTPPADLPPFYVRREGFGDAPPTPSGRAKAERFTLLVMLAVVILAIIGVLAAGAYVYMYDEPPPSLKKLSQTRPANPIIDDPPARMDGELAAEKVNMPRPSILVSQPRTAGPDTLTTVAEAAVPDTPAPKAAPKPKAKPKPRRPAPVPDGAREATARAPPAPDDPPLAPVEQADPQPVAVPATESDGSYQANFNLAFGVIVETRRYPSKKMKQRALELWAAEKKILEPDGSINDKYVLKPKDFSPIPGH